jgi:hypothetical protein
MSWRYVRSSLWATVVLDWRSNPVKIYSESNYFIETFVLLWVSVVHCQ